MQEPKRQTFSDKPQTIFGEQTRLGDRVMAEPRSDSKHERLKFLKTEKLHSSSHKEHPRLESKPHHPSPRVPNSRIDSKETGKRTRLSKLRSLLASDESRKTSHLFPRKREKGLRSGSASV